MQQVTDELFPLILTIPTLAPVVGLWYSVTVNRLNAKRNKGRFNIMAKGMGFKAAARSIQKKSHVSGPAAAAILAASTRKASPAAKKANPNLKKVK